MCEASGPIQEVHQGNMHALRQTESLKYCILGETVNDKWSWFYFNGSFKKNVKQAKNITRLFSAACQFFF